MKFGSKEKESTSQREVLPPYHSYSISEVEADLKTSVLSGLTDQDVEERRLEYGYNQLPESVKKKALIILLKQFYNTPTLILFSATVITLSIKDWAAAATIFVVIIFNSVIGFVQEHRAESTMSSLRKVSSSTARVIRNNGLVSTVPSRDLVPGDIIIMSSGDKIPADARIVEEFNFEVDESTLTGESLSVSKNGHVITSGNVALGDRVNMIYMGTSATSGRAKAIITATGESTEVGAISTAIKVESQKESKTPLQKQLSKLYVFLLVVALFLIILVFAVSKFAITGDVALYAVSLGIAIVPESLVTVVTLTLSLGIKKMSKSRAIVRSFSVMVFIGAVTDICSDKTGTLTQGKMTVSCVIVHGEEKRTVKRSTLSESAKFLDPNGAEVSLLSLSLGSRMLVECTAMCNNATINKISYTTLHRKRDAQAKKAKKRRSVFRRLFPKFIRKRYRRRKEADPKSSSPAVTDGEWVASGGPTEIALLAFTVMIGISKARISDPETGKYTIEVEYPFDSTIKTMSVLVRERSPRDLHLPSGNAVSGSSVRSGFNLGNSPPPEDQASATEHGGNDHKDKAPENSAENSAEGSQNAHGEGDPLRAATPPPQPSAVPDGSPPEPAPDGSHPPEPQILQSASAQESPPQDAAPQSAAPGCPEPPKNGHPADPAPQTGHPASSPDAAAPPKDAVGSAKPLGASGSGSNVLVDIEGNPLPNIIVFSKGSVESILSNCIARWDPKSQSFLKFQDIEDKKKITEEVNAHVSALASGGLRVIAFAFKRLPPVLVKESIDNRIRGADSSLTIERHGLENQHDNDASSERNSYRGAASESVFKDIPRDAVECDFIYLGLIGIHDPPRLETAGSVRECHRAGIAVRMLTGDHPATAESIARQVGILGADYIVGADKEHVSINDRVVWTGADFDALTDRQVDTLPHLPLVISRCTPSTKVKLVNAIKRRGGVVAMTGDGVNDSPSLKGAHVGIAMGKLGSDAAKEASDLILTDDNFATIVTAVAQGRRIFANILKFISHLMITNTGEIIALVFGLLIIDQQGSSVYPISPLQLLFMNMVTSSPPAIALGVEPPRKYQMISSKYRGGSIFKKGIMIDMVYYGTIMGLLTLGTFIYVIKAMSDTATIGSGCNSYHPSPYFDGNVYVGDCDSVYRARGAAFVTLTYLTLYQSFACRNRLQTTWHWHKTQKANYSLIACAIFGFLVIFPVVYIPPVAGYIFKSKPITTEWILVAISIVIYIILTEAYKFVLRVLETRQGLSRIDTTAEVFLGSSS